MIVTSIFHKRGTERRMLRFMLYRSKINLFVENIHRQRENIQVRKQVNIQCHHTVYRRPQIKIPQGAGNSKHKLAKRRISSYNNIFADEMDNQTTFGHRHWYNYNYCSCMHRRHQFEMSESSRFITGTSVFMSQPSSTFAFSRPQPVIVLIIPLGTEMMAVDFIKKKSKTPEFLFY